MVNSINGCNGILQEIFVQVYVCSPLLFSLFLVLIKRDEVALPGVTYRNEVLCGGYWGRRVTLYWPGATSGTRPYILITMSIPTQ